jgi:Chalcone isomerase-like
MRKIILTCCLLLSLSSVATALEIAGVQIPETLNTDLTLNGAGIRSKFFFKIYIAELYLEHPSQTAEKVLNIPGRKRLTMHILYDEVSKEKLVEGWNVGFGANLSDEKLKQLAPKIMQFNALFVTVHEGEEIILDYTPDMGTIVTIAGAQKGVIEGAAFNSALLSIWLGKEPVGDDLRDALLGIN